MTPVQHVKARTACPQTLCLTVRDMQSLLSLKDTAIAVQDGRFAPAQYSHLTSARSLGDAADADLHPS
jgi:hypothetical protein